MISLKASLLSLFAAGALALTACSSPSTMDSAAQFVSASDSRLRYEGRFDAADPAAPVVVWQGSRIALDFEGTQLALRFGPCVGQCFFNLQVDGGEPVLVSLREGGATRFVYPQPLAAGRHHMQLCKRSEADAGHATFSGVELAPGAKAWAPAVPAYKLAMQFFGDSITVGACNEDGVTDQWENRDTHNNARSYGAFTAEAFSADYRNIAVSGMGIVMGYVEVKAGQVWNRVYPKANAPLADLSTWTPDVVFVNYGENDDSFSKNQGKPFPEGFTDGYVALIAEMRRAYPHAQIVLLRGGMFGGARSEPLRNAWTEAVARIEAGDAKVHHFVFQHWTETHPRVVDDRAMADELIAWLRTQDFMQAHL